MTNKEVLTIYKEGYDDGYYWDLRVGFSYKGKEYTFIDVGSCSGYIPRFRAIKKECTEFLKGERNKDSYLDDIYISETELIRYVQQLGKSGDTELVIADENGIYVEAESKE